VQYSVRHLIEKTYAALCMQIRKEGTGVSEVDYWNDQAVIGTDSRYFSPTEVETLLGGTTKAKQKLSRVPEIRLDQMITKVATADLAETKKHALLKKHGFNVNVRVE
jgi:GDPmannose 4,6-dehydratase